MLVVVLGFFTSTLFAKGKVVVYQTLPNSQVRDYRAPTMVTEKTKDGVVIYQTLPNSQVRDYTAPSYKVKK